MQIPVIGVFFNEVVDFPEWLLSVESQKSEEIEPIPIIVVNDAPNSREYFENATDLLIQKGRVARENIHVLQANLGHAHAINVGIRHLQTTKPNCVWVASLDPDARFAPDALRQMHISVGNDLKVGMISPMVIRSRSNKDFQTPVAMDERLCHAGHYPFFNWKLRNGTPANYWSSYFFAGQIVGDVRNYLRRNPDKAPFATCFCASLWNMRMFDAIGLPDKHQFRTLDCGEICYRGQLNGWSGKFSVDALAFHPSSCTSDFKLDCALTKKDSKAWHYYHAQILIALKYLPDSVRSIFLNWDKLDHFGDFKEFSPETDDRCRQELFDRWYKFAFDLQFPAPQNDAT